MITQILVIIPIRRMKNKDTYLSMLVLSVLMIFAGGELFAQAHPDRRHVRSGNKAYESLDYSKAEEEYLKGEMKSLGTSYEAKFNLGDALYKQERYEEAESTFKQLSEMGHLTAEQKAKSFYNLGNSQFQQQKLTEALESYQNSLINNPSDLQAKHNLAYVQKLLEQQQDDNQGGGQDDKEEQQSDEEQNNDSGKQEESQSDPDQDNKDQDNKDQQEDDQQPEKPDQPEPQPEAAISKEDAEQMLEAIQRQEDKTREKLDEKKKAEGAPSGKNW